MEGKKEIEKIKSKEKNMPVIEMENVRKTYLMGDVKVKALCGINLKIYPGEFVAIIGHSGSGKSTLMNMVGSLDLPTAGKVKLSGVDITTLTESELAQWRGKKIGFVFQSFNLINTLTALENVALPLMFKNIPKEEAIEKSKKMLEKVGVGHRMNHLPRELSGGEQQRVAIARALVVDPELILADEPTGNIDYKSGLEIMKLFTKLHEEEKKTIVVVTHERFVAEHAERIIELRDGTIIKDVKNHEYDFNGIKRK